jgi:hypothetical protein
MTRIVWDAIGSRHFHVGVDRGVLYLQNGSGVPWNGLVAVNEAPSGADVVDGFYDGQKFFSRRNPEAFEATIEAYTYPSEFDEIQGLVRYTSGQTRQTFGFSYRTLLGNDVDGLDHGYLIHLVYNARVAPVSRSHRSLSIDVDNTMFSWAITTTPVLIADRVGSHLIIDSRVARPELIEILEKQLYGSSDNDPTFPSADEIIEMFEATSILRITDNEDGTWTAEGPDGVVTVTTSSWYEKRRNLFKDPLARTSSSVMWSSTANLVSNYDDSWGISWTRFTRGAAGNVRLADMKVGTDIAANSDYRFKMILKSSYDRTVTLVYRPDVAASGVSIGAGTVFLPANVAVPVDFALNTGVGTPTVRAGITIIHNGSVVGDTLDVTEVSVENLYTALFQKIVHGDAGGRNYSRYRWLATPNASASVYEERDEFFEITSPSAVYIDVDTYRVSSL